MGGDRIPRLVRTIYSRRRFLTASLEAATGLAIGGRTLCLKAAPNQATGSAVGFSLVDTHTHFYDPTRREGVPWPPREDKLLYRTVLPKDYQILPVPRPVTGTVVVEASPWVEDNQWVLDLAAMEPFIVGFVGNLAAGTKEFAQQLKRFSENNVFRGIRLGEGKLEQNLEDSTFISDLRLLADHDLSLDLVGGRPILGFAERLSKKVPTLRIIIDHLAGVVIDGKAPPADWITQMRSAARRPGIYCKVSALVEGTGRSDGTAPRDVQIYAPVLDAMREIFGPERLIYASNWPVSERFAPLGTVQGIVHDYFRSHGGQEEEEVFSRSGKRAYRWKDRPH
jgi:L-fuconolactonase